MAIEGTKGPGQESFGAQLNRMSGVQTEKNLYAEKGKMDKDAFLRMFTEQLKNQDPLNPQNSEQFSQQMAMFSQLEQQINMNKNLEKMIASQSNMQIAALQLVGKNIVADQAAIYHEKEKPSTLNFKLPQDAIDVSVHVTDLSGNVLKKINLGQHQQGPVTTKWDGMTDEGRPVETGRYTYKIVAKGADNKEMSIPTKVDGKVNGVTTVQGTVFLLVGDQKVGLNDVETIKDGNPPQQAQPGVKLPNETVGLPPGTESEEARSVREKKESEKSAKNVPEISIEDLDSSPIGGRDRFDPMIPLMFR